MKAGAELQRLIATLYELVERGDRALSAADRDFDSASDSTPSTSRSSSKSQSHAVASGGSDLRAARREEQVQVALQAAACIARVQADSDAHSAMLERTGAFLLHALETLSDQQSIAIVCSHSTRTRTVPRSGLSSIALLSFRSTFSVSFSFSFSCACRRCAH